MRASADKPHKPFSKSIKNMLPNMTTLILYLTAFRLAETKAYASLLQMRLKEAAYPTGRKSLSC